MTQAPLLKPQLYRPADNGKAKFLGGECSNGHVFFPMQTFGCERCGAHGDEISQIELSGAGVLISAATVHLHADPARPAPFVIGAIKLDEGPVVRTLLVDLPDAEQRVGQRVQAVLAATRGPDGEDVLDLRFGPA